MVGGGRNYIKIGWVILVIAMLGINSACSNTPARAEFSDWSVEELAERLRNNHEFILIDVRELDEYASGHIEGAQLIPLGKLRAEAKTLDRAKEYALICRSGNRSGQAAAILRSEGFSRVHNVVGGMLAWTGPVVTGE